MDKQKTGSTGAWIATTVLALLLAGSLIARGTWMGGWSTGWPLLLALALLALVLYLSSRNGRTVEAPAGPRPPERKQP